MHLGCFLVFWVGFSWVALAVAALYYAIRVFALTGFYHRYFSHRAFRTSRWFQFVGAVLGSAALQRGPLWWAAHHRRHHRLSDHEGDVHSPHQVGFWYSHMGWFLNKENFATDFKSVHDFAKYPELRFLDKYDLVVPLAFGGLLFGLGALLEAVAPNLGTTGWQMFVWGFFVSTVAVYHVTYTINSLAHLIGRRRFATKDDSRNNLVLALLTGGEGWHNNHHHYPASARQGFYWWEIDTTYYALVLLSWLGLVWDLKPVPAKVLAQAGRDETDLQAETGRLSPQVEHQRPVSQADSHRHVPLVESASNRGLKATLAAPSQNQLN